MIQNPLMINEWILIPRVLRSWIKLGCGEHVKRGPRRGSQLSLLPRTGSEQHEVLLFGSISEGILQARH